MRHGFQAAGSGTETLLYFFACEEDGYDPQSMPIVDSKGRFYAADASVYSFGNATAGNALPVAMFLYRFSSPRATCPPKRASREGGSVGEVVRSTGGGRR